METRTENLLSSAVVVVNIRFSQFAKNLVEHWTEDVQVDWKLPAGGDNGMMGLLDFLIRGTLQPAS